MMSISSSAAHIEITLASERRLSVDRASLTGVLLAAERLPCGRIRQTLLLTSSCTLEPVRIEASAAELGALHQYFLETLAGSAAVH